MLLSTQQLMNWSGGKKMFYQKWSLAAKKALLIQLTYRCSKQTMIVIFSMGIIEEGHCMVLEQGGKNLFQYY